jgi:cell division protein FtsL
MAVAARRLPPVQGRRWWPVLVAARPRAVPSGRRIPFLVFALAVVTALVVGVVTAQTLVAQGSFRLQELATRADRLEAQFGRLRLRADRLSALERIERAGERAGLVIAGQYHPLPIPGRHAQHGPAGVAPGLDAAAQAKAALGAEG